MNSNKQPEQVKALYLKEFFGRYFERKESLQIIYSLSNGLKVLQVIIENFQHSQGIEQSVKPILSHQSTSNFLSDINYQAQQLNLTLQSIYDRLRNIFDSFSLIREKQTEVTLKTSRSVTNFNEGDQQLYQMLNTYKGDLKKEKQQKKKLQKEVNRLTQEIDRLQEQKRCLNSKIQEKETFISINSKKTQLLEKDNHELKEQTIELQSKLEEFLELSESFIETKKENETLNQKCSEYEIKLKLLNDKFKAIDTIVLSKIHQNQTKWKQMISEKLESMDIYKNPTCKVFKQFISSFSKENIVPNTAK